jgi:tyrosine-protein kinase Etk/Wzc
MALGLDRVFEVAAEKLRSGSDGHEGSLLQGPLPQGARDREVSVASYVWIVRQEKWTILAITLLAVALALAYLFVVPPVYEATSIVQVEQKRRSLTGIDELAALGGTAGEPEIATIRSRELIGAIVDQLQLVILVHPRSLPLIGPAIDRRHDESSLAPAPLGLAKFAWGGERIQVATLEVPGKLLDTTLLLTAMADGAFVLASHDGTVVVRGSVGRVASAGQGSQRIELLVSELVARPGTQFWVTKRTRDPVIDALQNEIKVEVAGKSGLLSIKLQSTDPAYARSIVNGITNAYLRQNVERRSGEAAKTLAFLEGQLPRLKANVDAAETALNTFRVQSGTIDPGVEMKGIVERIAQLDKEISDAEVRRSELSQLFTAQHPNRIAMAEGLALLRSERTSLSERMRSAPQAELNSIRLDRALKDATELYVGLLNKAQELRVAKSGTIGDVTIIDRAYVPKQPLKPEPVVVMMLGLVLGLAVGVTAVFLRRGWIERVESAEEVERETGLPVCATVPHSKVQARLARETRKQQGSSPLLAISHPEDIAVEAIRSLRTTLRFALVDARNIVALTGPAPGVGKSFLAANLAQVVSASGSKVLLVDADLRRGQLHRQFGIDRQPGLSDIVSGAATLDEAIVKMSGGVLSVLPTGHIPPNPAELLSSAAFELLLNETSARFDLVIIDTPPVLAVTDAMLVARFAGVSFLVLRAGKHTHHEIALTAKEFAVNGVKLHWAVMNDIRTVGGLNQSTGYVRYSYSSELGE